MMKLLNLKIKIRKKLRIFHNMWLALLLLLGGFGGLYYFMFFKPDHIIYLLHYLEIFVITLVLSVISWLWAIWDGADEPFAYFINPLICVWGCLLGTSILLIKIMPETNLYGTIYAQNVEMKNRRGGTTPHCKIRFDADWLKNKKLSEYHQLIEDDYMFDETAWRSFCEKSGKVNVYDKTQARVQSNWFGARIEIVDLQKKEREYRQ